MRTEALELARRDSHGRELEHWKNARPILEEQRAAQARELEKLEKEVLARLSRGQPLSTSYEQRFLSITNSISALDFFLSTLDGVLKEDES